MYVVYQAHTSVTWYLYYIYMCAYKGQQQSSIINILLKHLYHMCTIKHLIESFAALSFADCGSASKVWSDSRRSCRCVNNVFAYMLKPASVGIKSCRSRIGADCWPVLYKWSASIRCFMVVDGLRDLKILWPGHQVALHCRWVKPKAHLKQVQADYAQGVSCKGGWGERVLPALLPINTTLYYDYRYINNFLLHLHHPDRRKRGSISFKRSVNYRINMWAHFPR